MGTLFATLHFAAGKSQHARGRHTKQEGLLTHAENPVNDGIVATVAHGQPVAYEEHDVDEPEAETRKELFARPLV